MTAPLGTPPLRTHCAILLRLQDVDELALGEKTTRKLQEIVARGGWQGWQLMARQHVEQSNPGQRSPHPPLALPHHALRMGRHAQRGRVRSAPMLEQSYTRPASTLPQVA